MLRFWKRPFILELINIINDVTTPILFTLLANSTSKYIQLAEWSWGHGFEPQRRCILQKHGFERATHAILRAACTSRALHALQGLFYNLSGMFFFRLTPVSSLCNFQFRRSFAKPQFWARYAPYFARCALRVCFKTFPGCSSFDWHLFRVCATFSLGEILQQHSIERAMRAILSAARATRFGPVLKSFRDDPLSIDTCFESVRLLV